MTNYPLTDVSPHVGTEDVLSNEVVPRNSVQGFLPIDAARMKQLALRADALVKRAADAPLDDGFYETGMDATQTVSSAGELLNVSLGSLKKGDDDDLWKSFTQFRGELRKLDHPSSGFGRLWGLIPGKNLVDRVHTAQGTLLAFEKSFTDGLVEEVQRKKDLQRLREGARQRLIMMNESCEVLRLACLELAEQVREARAADEPDVVKISRLEEAYMTALSQYQDMLANIPGIFSAMSTSTALINNSDLLIRVGKQTLHNTLPTLVLNLANKAAAQGSDDLQKKIDMARDLTNHAIESSAATAAKVVDNTIRLQRTVSIDPARAQAALTQTIAAIDQLEASRPETIRQLEMLMKQTEDFVGELGTRITGMQTAKMGELTSGPAR